MTHGTTRVGEFEITALCDVVGHFPQPFSEAFPTIPPERHDEIRRRYPDAFDGPDVWLLHDHCFVVRTPSVTILVDTGVGGTGTLGSQWIRSPGGLPSELEAAGVGAEDVDHVVITHAHLDHIGWNVIHDGPGPLPRFPNARNRLQRAEWEVFTVEGDDYDRQAFAHSLSPLEPLGVLRLVDGEERVAA